MLRSVDDDDVVYARVSTLAVDVGRGWIIPPVPLRAKLAAPNELATMKFPRFPEQSFNLAHLGKPVDVLLPTWAREGVFGIAVEPVRFPITIKGKNARTIHFDVIHVPLDGNYGHCEMTVVENGTRITGNTPDSAKTAWRSVAWEHMKVYRFRTPDERFAYIKRRLGR